MPEQTGSITAAWRDGDRVIVSWESHNEYHGGPAPTPEIKAALGRSAAGTVALDIASGKLERRAAVPPPPLPAAARGLEQFPVQSGDTALWVAGDRLGVVALDDAGDHRRLALHTFAAAGGQLAGSLTDLAARWMGFDLNFEYFLGFVSNDAWQSAAPGAPYVLPASSFDNHGYYVQAAYFIIPKKLQIAARYSAYEANIGSNTFSEATEIGVAVNYYIDGHADKVTLDVAFSIVTRPGTSAAEVKTVAAFPVAAAQVRNWLAANLPGAETVLARSNAAAADRSNASEPGDAAMCSPIGKPAT